MIHKTAIIDSNAKISANVKIGAYSIIGANVEIDQNSEIQSHVSIVGNTKIGKNNKIYPFSSIGNDPQDLKFNGEKTNLEIGDNNKIREYVTINPGTTGGGGLTKIGNNCLFMVSSHIAHDCIVGDNTVFANNVGISGHVQVGDWAILGGYAGVNQFLKIGSHAMVGAMTHITNDIPAFMIVSGRPATVRSINAIGLERRGLDKETIVDLREAYKIIYKRNYSLQEAIDQLKAMREGCETMQVLIDSLESSEKGIHR